MVVLLVQNVVQKASPSFLDTKLGLMVHMPQLAIHIEILAEAKLIVEVREMVYIELVQLEPHSIYIAT